LAYPHASAPRASCATAPHSAAHTHPQWISEVLHFCSGLPIILVGCKKDLVADPKVIEDLKKLNQAPVSFEEGQRVANKIGAYKFLWCSARTGDGVNEVFETAARAALDSKKKTGKKGCLLL
jgi:Ras family protein A